MLTAIGILIGSAFACLLAPKRSRGAPWICALGCATASVFAIDAAFGVLAGGAPVEARFAFGVPGGSLTLALDPLSAFFLVLIAVIAPLAAIFGAGYLARHRPGGGTRAASFFFCLLTASMMLVVAARNGVLFLVAWETMTLTSWVLVVFDHDQEAVRSAGRRYLIASQLGGACLVVLFTVLGRSAGSLDFAALAERRPGSTRPRSPSC